MKKILFIVPALMQVSGVAAFMMNYLKNFKLDNFEVEIIYNDFNVSNEYIKILNERNIKLYKLPYIRNTGLNTYNNEIKKFFKVHNDYEVIYSNASYQSYLFFKEAKKYGIKKMVMHSHATQSSDKKIKNFVGSIVQRHTNKLVKYRIACSKVAGLSMFKDNDFIVINNAVDYEKFKFNNTYRNNIRNYYNINDNQKVIGYVGRFSTQKNVFFFIELVKRLSIEYKIIMIGTGSLKDEFIKKAREENVENKFIYVDETPTVNEYYSAFDYFVLPSLFEGLPVVGVEAQANGLPCLFSNTISDECKLSDNTVYLDRNNVNAWIKSINEMKRKDTLMLNDKFDINIQSKRFESLLVKIIND